MEKLQKSVESVLEDRARASFLMPDLPTGAWAAAAEPVGRLLADYGLVAELSGLYDRVEDLRWRLRHKAEASLHDPVAGQRLSAMVDALACEIATDLEHLLPRVKDEADKPNVQRLGVLHRVQAAVALSFAIGGRGTVGD